MNQTKKRLAIINLAISITDIETIQLQVLKLGLLKTDSKMQKILSLLNEQNYAQAQRLITDYIDAPTETILQRISQKEELEIIDEFDLFTEASHNTLEKLPQEKINYNDFLDIATKPIKMSTENINYDSLLNIEAHNVLPDNIEINISKEATDTFFEEHPIQSSSPHTKDTFFEDSQEENDSIKKDLYQKEAQEKLTDSIKSKEDMEDGAYKSIPYIDQKLEHMCKQYPPISLTDNHYFSVENWLLQISTKGYTESEIETLIDEAIELSKSNLSEAAQLLLIAASTESKYAQFRLARALYIGDILQKNITESVTIIQHLALNENYPEAICDLGQFYENGIVVNMDNQKAKVLYQEAMELGINRATNHYERLDKKNKSVLSVFKK